MGEASYLEFLSGVVGDWAQENAPLLLAALLALLLIQSIRLSLLRGAAGRRVARHKRLGEDAERRARSLLKKKGYRITGEQGGGAYDLIVDGEKTPVHLRADYLVEKRGKRYVAEVKSGVESAKVTARTTRRQLLEYLFAFDVDGVLLVDMHAERIRLVQFPDLKGH